MKFCQVCNIIGTTKPAPKTPCDHKVQIQVTDAYKSPLSRKEGFQPHLRCKINFAGPQMCRFWNSNNERTEMCTELRALPCIPRVQISHLWLMAKEMGEVCNVNDLKLMATNEACPF